MTELIEKGHLLADIREVLLSARKTAYKAVNFAMVSAYWNVGRKTDGRVWKRIYLNQPEKHATILSDIPKKSHTAWRIDMVALSPANQSKRQQCTLMVHEHELIRERKRITESEETNRKITFIGDLTNG